MAVKELGKTIGKSVTDKKSMQTELIKPGTLNTRFVFGSYELTVKNTRILVESQVIGSAMIWGNPSKGVYGTSTWGGSLPSYSTVETITVAQSVTNAGRVEIAKWLGGEAATAPSHFGFGTGSTAYTVDDTALETAVGRKAIDSRTLSTNSVTTKICIVNSIDTSLHGSAMREVGVFNAAASGDLYSRYIITSLTMTNANNYRFTVDTTWYDTTPGRGIWTTVGLNEMRDWLGAASATAPIETAWGTGTTNPAIADTTLEGEQERNAFTTTSRVNTVVTYEALLAASEATSQDLYKSGLFNAAASGDLFVEQKFAKISKTALFQVYEYDVITVL